MTEIENDSNVPKEQSQGIVYPTGPFSQIETTSPSHPSPYAIPTAIVLAGVIIAGAVIYSGNRNTAELAAVAAGDNNDNAAAEVRGAENVIPFSEQDFILGSPDAGVKIITFSDFECPYCKRFHYTMKQVMQEYGPSGQVAWIYRHFPLDSLHRQAREEAIAAECAGRLGGNNVFWRYADKIFETTTSNDGLDLALLDQFATELGIEPTAFTSCRSDAKTAETVSTQFDNAVDSGGTGTPYSVIIGPDGRAYPFSGAQDYEKVKAAIAQLTS